MYYRSFVHWFNRMHSEPGTYTTERIIARAYQLGPEIAALKKLTTQEPFPEGWTGVEWLEKHEEMRRLMGQLHAIQEVLAGRERMSPPAKERLRFSTTSRHGSERSISTPAPEPESSDPAGIDPFQEE